MTFTLPPDTRAIGTGNPPGDMNAVVDALTALGALYSVLNTVNGGGADPTGGTDVAAAVNAASAAGVAHLPPGTFLLNSSTALTGPVRGAGMGLTTLKIGASFSGAAAVVVGADSVEVRDLAIAGASGTTTSNPAAHGIQLTGRAHVVLDHLAFKNVNGYAIESVGGSSAANVDLMISTVIARNCAALCHLKGVTGSSFLGEHMVSNVTGQQIGVASGTYANLDAFLVEDVSDVEVSQLNIGMASSQTGSAVHVTGACASIYFNNPDCGANQLSGGSPAVHIDSGSNGTPSDVVISNGVFEGGKVCFQLDAGTDIRLLATRFHQAYGSGLVVNGGELHATGVLLNANNQSGGTAYDIDTSGQGSGSNAYFVACKTGSAVAAATAGSVTNPVNVSTHSYFDDCKFVGTGTSPSNVFNGTPQRVVNCVGYNPRGLVTSPSVGTSPFTPGTYQTPLVVIFTAVNGMTDFAIGGTSVGLPQAGVPYYLGPRLSMTITWATSAPTMIWLGN